MTFDSNLSASSEGESDVFLTATPSVEYRRDAALLQVAATVGASAELYASNSELNGMLPFASAGLRWQPPEAKTDAAASASYRRDQSANTLVNTRTESDALGARILFGHLPSEKYGYRLRSSWSQTTYTDAGLAQTSEFGAGADARYAYSPKLEFALALDGRLARTATVGSRPGLATSDVSLRVVADGDLLPKVSGRVAVGWGHRAFTSGQTGSDDAPSAEVALTWTPEEATSVTLVGGIDFDLSPISESLRTTEFLLTARREVAAGLTLSTAAGITLNTYSGGSGREDTIGELRAGATYAFSPTLSGSASLRWQESSSTLPQATFSRVVAEAGISTRF